MVFFFENVTAKLQIDLFRQVYFFQSSQVRV